MYGVEYNNERLLCSPSLVDGSGGGEPALLWSWQTVPIVWGGGGGGGPGGGGPKNGKSC
jgi:hypothetical protein